MSERPRRHLIQELAGVPSVCRVTASPLIRRTRSQAPVGRTDARPGHPIRCRREIPELAAKPPCQLELRLICTIEVRQAPGHLKVANAAIKVFLPGALARIPHECGRHVGQEHLVLTEFAFEAALAACPSTHPALFSRQAGAVARVFTGAPPVRSPEIFVSVEGIDPVGGASEADSVKGRVCLGRALVSFRVARGSVVGIVLRFPEFARSLV